MVGAHASFTLSPETLDACVDVARSGGAGIHVHVAEDFADQVDSEARFGMSVAERLAKAGALTKDALLAHCVYLSPSELRIVVESGTTIAHNTRSNMNNSVGHAPVRSFHRLAVGTDGVGGDSGQLRRRVADVAPDYGVRHGIDEFSGVDGGVPRADPYNTVAFGRTHHRIAISTPSRTPAVRHTPLRSVRDVMVDGEMAVRDRRVTKLDQDKVFADASAAADLLFARLETIDPHPFQPAGVP